MKILIVEDDALIAMELEASLSDAGHTVVGPASTVGRAIERAAANVPDLALVDIRLRDGGDGIELARRLRREFGLRALFVSAQRLEARHSRDAAIGFLCKPFTPHVLLATIACAEAVLQGERPPPPMIPHGLELF